MCFGDFCVPVGECPASAMVIIMKSVFAPGAPLSKVPSAPDVVKRNSCKNDCQTQSRFTRLGCKSVNDDSKGSNDEGNGQDRISNNAVRTVKIGQSATQDDHAGDCRSGKNPHGKNHVSVKLLKRPAYGEHDGPCAQHDQSDGGSLKFRVHTGDTSEKHTASRAGQSETPWPLLPPVDVPPSPVMGEREDKQRWLQDKQQ